MKVKESLNVTFDESPPPAKLSQFVDDDVGEEDDMERKAKVDNNSVENESIEVDEIVNIKESKNHLLEQVIGNLNQITLRSQAQNKSNFFCFISTIEPKNVNEALGDVNFPEDEFICRRIERGSREDHDMDMTEDRLGGSSSSILIKRCGGPSSAVPEASHIGGHPLSIVTSHDARHHWELVALHVRLEGVETIQTEQRMSEEAIMRDKDGTKD
ncbi:hypothetical protein Tco_1457003 [Tanacetum coccineum]